MYWIKIGILLPLMNTKQFLFFVPSRKFLYVIVAYVRSHGTNNIANTSTYTWNELKWIRHVTFVWRFELNCIYMFLIQLSWQPSFKLPFYFFFVFFLSLILTVRVCVKNFHSLCRTSSYIRLRSSQGTYQNGILMSWFSLFFVFLFCCCNITTVTNQEFPWIKESVARFTLYINSHLFIWLFISSEKHYPCSIARVTMHNTVQHLEWALFKWNQFRKFSLLFFWVRLIFRGWDVITIVNIYFYLKSY